MSGVGTGLASTVRSALGGKAGFIETWGFAQPLTAKLSMRIVRSGIFRIRDNIVAYLFALYDSNGIFKALLACESIRTSLLF